MLREVTTIKIKQNPKSKMIGIDGKAINRGYTLEFNFVKEWEYSTSWENLTSTGKISFPKNITVHYYLDQGTYNVNQLNANGVANAFNNVLQYKDSKQQKNLAGKNINISDLFRRGDNIQLYSHYQYWNKKGEVETTPEILICNGWISSVKSDNLIELEFEDHMYLLKQIAMDNYVFPAKTNIIPKLSQIINTSLIGTGGSGTLYDYLGTATPIKITLNKTDNNIITSVGGDAEDITFDGPIIASKNETVAQFLTRLKKELFIKIWFEEKVLGQIELFITYFPYTYNTNTSYISTGEFQFQNNIISNDLIYKRKDDVKLSAVASNHINEPNGTTKDGKIKMKKKRIEVLVEINKNGTGNNDDVTVTSIKKGDTVASNEAGERRTFTFLQANTEAELEQLAKAQLLLYYNNGFSGKFTTFGTPHINHGEIITLSNKDITSEKPKELKDINTGLVNPAIIDREGQYFVKGVNYSGGINGYRQEIILDFKLLK